MLGHIFASVVVFCAGKFCSYKCACAVNVWVRAQPLLVYRISAVCCWSHAHPWCNWGLLVECLPAKWHSILSENDKEKYTYRQVNVEKKQ